jgi:hypothetical protein
LATRLVHPLPPPLAAELVEGFRDLGTALVSDGLERLRGS